MSRSFDLPDDCLIEIGKVVVAWNLLENTLDLALTKLLSSGSLDKLGDRGVAGAFIVTAHMSVPQRLQALRSFLVLLSQDRKHPYIRKFDKEVKRAIDDAYPLRNDVIHSRWIGGNGKAMRTNISARKEIELTAEFVTAKDIEKARNSIEFAQMTLDKFLDSFS